MKNKMKLEGNNPAVLSVYNARNENRILYNSITVVVTR